MKTNNRMPLTVFAIVTLLSAVLAEAMGIAAWAGPFVRHTHIMTAALVVVGGLATALSILFLLDEPARSLEKPMEDGAIDLPDGTYRMSLMKPNPLPGKRASIIGWAERVEDGLSYSFWILLPAGRLTPTEEFTIYEHQLT